MDILSILFLAVGLAMDCFAVSITKGLQNRRWTWYALLMAVCFGLFQGGMPLIGFFAGTLFAEWVCRFDHWIALILLGYIGGKMIYEGIHEKQEDTSSSRWSVGEIILLSVATSIDALATGVLFVPCPEVVWLAVGIIALVSLMFALTGYMLACRLGNRLKLRTEIIGGIILIGIGLKIFIEHAVVNGELIH